MFATGERVETPFWVGKVVSADDDCVAVERSSDGYVGYFVSDVIQPYRVYSVGEIIHVSGKIGSNRAEIAGYATVTDRLPINGGRFSYGLILDDGTELWAGADELRAIGSIVGDYPAWDRLDEQPS